MIVKYLNLHNKEIQYGVSVLERGHDYQILDISFWKNNQLPSINILVNKEYYYPASFDLDLFEVINGSVPADWIFYNFESCYSLCPQEFIGDFWDRYHDGDQEAETVFETVVRNLQKFHGWPVKKILENDSFEQLFKQYSNLKDEYYHYIDNYRNQYHETVAVKIKLQCIIKVMLDHISNNTLSPQLVIDILNVIEDYSVGLENTDDINDVKVECLEPLMNILQTVDKSDQRYRYVELFVEYLGPACEDLCQDYNNFWQTKIMDKKSRYN